VWYSRSPVFEVSAHLGNIMGGKRKRAEGAVVAPAGANM